MKNSKTEKLNKWTVKQKKTHKLKNSKTQKLKQRLIEIMKIIIDTKQTANKKKWKTKKQNENLKIWKTEKLKN